MERMAFFIPKKVYYRSKYPSWFSKDLRHCLRHKLHYHPPYRKTGQHDWYTRTLVNVERLRSDCLSMIDNNTISLWTNRYIHNLSVCESLSKKPRMLPPSPCDMTTMSFSDLAYVADIFASHFRSCVNANGNFFPSSNINCIDFLTVCPVDESEVLKGNKNWNRSCPREWMEFLVQGLCSIVLSIAASDV